MKIPHLNVDLFLSIGWFTLSVLNIYLGIENMSNGNNFFIMDFIFSACSMFLAYVDFRDYKNNKSKKI